MSSRTVMTAMVVAMVAGSAWAVPITWTFSGELTQVSDYGSLPGDVVVGMPFSGSFTYEPPIPDSLPDSETQAIYHVGPQALQVQIGSYQIISADENSISVISSPATDRVWLGALDLDTPFGLATEWDLLFTDADSDILSSTDLPLTPPPLEPLETKRMLGQGAGFRIEGMVLQLIPEPGCITLAIALSACVLIRRPRRCAIL
jgi:hypothetical protein